MDQEMSEITIFMSLTETESVVSRCRIWKRSFYLM